ncbi:hypothetical protein BDV06DRAFT_218699 [Aspergillus oleicola]
MAVVWGSQIDTDIEELLDPSWLYATHSKRRSRPSRQTFSAAFPVLLQPKVRARALQGIGPASSPSTSRAHSAGNDSWSFRTVAQLWSFLQVSSDHYQKLPPRRSAHKEPETGLPRVSPGSPDIRSPVQRMYEALGSTTNPTEFTLLEDAVNVFKGRLEVFNNPMALRDFRERVSNAATGHPDAELLIEEFMSPLRETVAMFQYLNNPETITRLDGIVARVYTELQRIERNVGPGAPP